MITDDYLKLLNVYDKASRDREVPAGFIYEDYKSILKDSEEMGIFIEQKYPETFVSHHHAQDASYSVRTIVYRNELENSGPAWTLLYSNFGRMATIVPFQETTTPPSFEEIILKLEELEFKYIPYEILKRQYQGVLDLPHNFTWWNRFFDET